MGEYARSLLVKLPITFFLCVVGGGGGGGTHTHTHTHVHVCAPTDIHLSIGNRQSVLVFVCFVRFARFVPMSVSLISCRCCLPLSFHSTLSLSPTKGFFLFFLCCCVCSTTTALDSVASVNRPAHPQDRFAGGFGVIMIAAVEPNRLSDK